MSGIQANNKINHFPLELKQLCEANSKLMEDKIKHIEK